MDFAGHCSRRPHSHRHKLTIILNGMDQSISLDSTCFEAQDVSGSKPSDSQGKAKPSRRASVRWRRRRLCRRRGAWRFRPRGGAAEVRHCPLPVRCSGWGGVPGSAALSPLVVARRWLAGPGAGAGAASAHGKCPGLGVGCCRCQSMPFVVRTVAPHRPGGLRAEA